MFLPFLFALLDAKGLATDALAMPLSGLSSTSPRPAQQSLLHAPLFVLILPKASSFAQITVRSRNVRFKVAELGWHRLTSCPIPVRNVMIRP